MKRVFAYLFRHGTPIAWAMLALAWVPIVVVKTFGDDSWAVFGWLLLLAVAAMVWNVVGAILAALSAIGRPRKRLAVLACVANLASLCLLLGTLG